MYLQVHSLPPFSSCNQVTLFAKLLSCFTSTLTLKLLNYHHCSHSKNHCNPKEKDVARENYKRYNTTDILKPFCRIRKKFNTFVNNPQVKILLRVVANRMNTAMVPKGILRTRMKPEPTYDGWNCWSLSRWIFQLILWFAVFLPSEMIRHKIE